MSADGISPQLVLALAVIGASLLAIVEWRRGNQRNRAARVLASVIAAAALCLLGIDRMRADEQAREIVREAVLWTGNGEPGVQGSAGANHFALPRATGTPAGAVTVPDVAYLMREHPELKTLRIVGSGLEPFEIAPLADVNLVFDRQPDEPRPPTISSLHVPRQIALGEPLRVQGQIVGLRPGEAMTLTLIAPDGTKTETTVSGDGSGQTKFEFGAKSPASAGRFVWRLTARANAAPEAVFEEKIGIAVVPPAHPRVLAIDSAPRLDTAHLERWYRELGATLVSRTTIAEGRYRYAGSDDSVTDFGAIDGDLLRRFDVLLIDATALSALAAEERQAIEAAIAEQGLGLLGFPPASERGSDDSLFPWRLEPDTEVAVPGEPRTARLQWRGQHEPLEQPVAIENVRLQLAATERTLVADTQGRAVAGVLQHGRGRIAVSIARDTWRWRLQDQSSAFAAYWSHVLRELARPRDAQVPRWGIENPASAPLTANQPVLLRLTGPEQLPLAAHVTADREPDVALALAEDEAGLHQWGTTFWPRRAGWHRVQLGSGEAYLDFFVHEPGAWASLASERRAAATRAAAAGRPVKERTPAATDARVQSGAAPAVALYVFFVLGAGYLWLERRRVAA